MPFQFEQHQVSNDEFSLLKGTEMEFNFQFIRLFHFCMLYFFANCFFQIFLWLGNVPGAQCHNSNATATQSIRADLKSFVLCSCGAICERRRKKNVITFLFFNFPAFSQYIFHYKIFLELKRESSGIESLFCFLQRILQKILHCKRTQNRHTKNIA